MNKKKIKFIDLFCGIGGFRVAFESLHCECVFSSDIDKYAGETYYSNFGEYPAGDITKIPTENIPDHDILCAGFPCQAFSIGGYRKGFEDHRGTLFFEVARILKGKKPKAFLLENVAGIINHDKGKTISVIEDCLKDLGYNFEYRLINALDMGIPQNRLRWYCVGFRNDLGVKFGKDSRKSNFYFPENKDLDYWIEDIIDKRQEGYKPTLRATENILSNLKIYKKQKNTIEDKYTLANEIRPSRCSFRNNGTAPCLTAKMGTGGNNVPVVVELNRKLTEKECLAIMGFPSGFFIQENKMQTYKQIGNSIVIPVIEAIGNEIVKVLNRSRLRHF